MLLNLFQKKTCIVCIHGFGRRRVDEFNNLVSALDKKYDFVIPNLYDLKNPEDTDAEKWIERADNALRQAMKTNRKVYLIGFSMGGVIASHLASKYNVERVVLIDPAFDYITLKTAQQTVGKIFTKKAPTTSKYPELPSSFTSTFMKVVNTCKEDIEQVKCPILFISASDDEVIPNSSSTKTFRKVKNPASKCITLEGGQHRLLDDSSLSKTTIFLIDNFIQAKF